MTGVGRFLKVLLERVYSQRYLRLYQLQIAQAAAVPVTVPLDDVRLLVIESRKQALELAAQGFENILEATPGAGRRLSHGCVAACAFMGRELVSIDWMALTDRAKRALDALPISVDFAAGEAYASGAFTVRRWRGRGIGSYRFSAVVTYLHARGYHTCYSYNAIDNLPSQRCVERYGATFEAVFLHRRVLGHNILRQVRGMNRVAIMPRP